jgi:hypothetical protein
VTPVSSCSNDISSVANRTSAPSSRALSRSRISSLSWSIGPNAEGLAESDASPSFSSIPAYSSSARVSARTGTQAYCSLLK